MKKHVKLFEEFLLEEDVLADLGLGDLGNDEEKKKGKEEPEKKKKEEEDPFKKEKRAAKKRKEREEKEHEEYVEKKKDKIEDILKDYPEVEEELGNKIIAAVNSQDRVKIHNAFNDLMALQIKFQEEGNVDAVEVS